ncbi:MAG: NUDIX domain-containing protein [Chloroflexi bacterium]|nr:NUDIX domain-containing protein [Chloroflexota bacterium]
MSRFPVVAHVFLLRDGLLLLLRRSQTGSANGQYAPAGGHLEPGESICEAAIRECREEVGVELDPAHLRVIGVSHYRTDHGQGIDFFLTATRWSGEPYPRAECDEVRWCAPDDLPELTLPFVRRALAHHLWAGEWFDETEV